jgi:hypothetical protein
MPPLEKDDELYALRSPLSPADVVARLQQLGPSASRATPHHQVLAVEVFSPEDPFSAPIDVEIEARPLGSYVTARVGDNTFLRDFTRVVAIVLTLYAVAAAGYIVLHVTDTARVRALLSVAAGWGLLLGALSLTVQIITRDGGRDLKRARIRHQLARLLCRDR